MHTPNYSSESSVASFLDACEAFSARHEPTIYVSEVSGEHTQLTSPYVDPNENLFHIYAARSRAITTLAIGHMDILTDVYNSYDDPETHQAELEALSGQLSDERVGSYTSTIFETLTDDKELFRLTVTRVVGDAALSEIVDYTAAFEFAPGIDQEISVHSYQATGTTHVSDLRHSITVGRNPIVTDAVRHFLSKGSAANPGVVEVIFLNELFSELFSNEEKAKENQLILSTFDTIDAAYLNNVIEEARRIKAVQATAKLVYPSDVPTKDTLDTFIAALNAHPKETIT